MNGTRVREELVCGVGPWYWPEKDVGAWGAPNDGPHNEFPGLRDQVLGNTLGRKVIVQAGGCCGMYPRLWAEHFEYVWTFEPDAVNFHHLVLNCPSQNIFKFQAALGNGHGILWLRRSSPDNVGMHNVSMDEGGLMVPCLSIDELGLPACDAIQLDVERSEEFVIKGAAKTIEHFRPTIAIETVTDWTKSFLQKLGYREVGRNYVDTIWKVR